MKPVVTFGEIMGRLAPHGFLRLRQSLPGCLDITFSGAEANVAASLAMFGATARFVSALPDNPVADACVGTLKGLGIDTKWIVRSDRGRLGLYFLETGANQRSSQVVYDRDSSTISMTGGDAYDWENIFRDAAWLHVSGITPALSKTAAEAVLQAVKLAKEKDLTVSCDLNFRKKLWKWDNTLSSNELARKTMEKIIPFVDVLIANEEDCEDVLSIKAGKTNVDAGKLDVDRYPDVAREVIRRFPNIKMVATTLRESISASHNNWGGMLYLAGKNEALFAPRSGDEYKPYEIKNIVDRVGGGDSFSAGLIFGLLEWGFNEPLKSLDFAAAASCLAHSISGDFNYASKKEVESLMKGKGSGRVVR